MRCGDDNQQHRTLVHNFCAISVQMRGHYNSCRSNSKYNKIGCTDPWDFLETHKSRQDLVYTANISYNPASLHWTRCKKSDTLQRPQQNAMLGNGEVFIIYNISAEVSMRCSECSIFHIPCNSLFSWIIPLVSDF